MAPIDAAKVTEQAPPVGDSKTDSTHLENVEAGVKLTQFDGERVIVTDQDVSPSSQLSTRHKRLLLLTVANRTGSSFVKQTRQS